ncbi:hypothetical protein DSO57_1004033 [Entomophthora muscae]|uniref:Uncharacterized protein n=1 Tax=Entomophthora muscae TaxID=34485 RepID=A0ACC2T839_9FUNG|nr:hypothetical protein DSO57_1004033 [Entomophthora muscae]
MQGYTGSSNNEASVYGHSNPQAPPQALPRSGLWGSYPPVPKCVLDCSQGPAGRGCHSLSSNNILDSLYLVLDFCTSVLDVCSFDLDSCSLNLDSGAALRIQLPIIGLLLHYLGLYQSKQAPAGDQKASKTSWQKLRRPVSGLTILLLWKLRPKSGNQTWNLDSPGPPGLWTAGTPTRIFLGLSPCKLMLKMMAHPVKQIEPRKLVH